MTMMTMTTMKTTVSISHGRFIILGQLINMMIGSVSAAILCDITDDSGIDEFSSRNALLAKLNERRDRLRELKGYIDRYKEKKKREIRELKAKINRLERLREPPEPSEPWHEMLEKHLNGEHVNGEDESEVLKSIYKVSCRQMNMSQKPEVKHPDLKFSGSQYSDEQMETLWLQASAVNVQGGAHGDDQGDGDDSSESNAETVMRPFRFNDLPREVQQIIFEKLFVKKGVVHCLSRMDGLNMPRSPEQFPWPGSGISKLPHRFAFGKRPCSIVSAKQPGQILAPLQVCKRWLYIGMHAFYGMNTFAFSSFGEFGRFCNGIGFARAERIAHVELFWHGSVLPRHKSRINQRTLPLVWFTKLKSLQTLVIHMQENEERRKSNSVLYPHSCVI